MNCNEWRERLPDYLAKRLPEEALRLFQAHASACDDCGTRLAQLEAAWNRLGELPDEEPRPELRSRFYAMLEEEKRALNRAGRETLLKRVGKRIESLWPSRPALQMTAAALLLVIGMAAGFTLKNGGAGNGDVLQLRGEVEEMRRMMSLSLLNQNMSTQRLRGVNMSTEISEPSGALLTSLANTMQSDPSVNVRLAAVDALSLFRDEPGVVEAAMKALSQESSPVVQIALIDFMIEVQEKRALEALRNFIQLKNIDPTVKEHAEESISVVM